MLAPDGTQTPSPPFIFFLLLFLLAYFQPPAKPHFVVLKKIYFYSMCMSTCLPACMGTVCILWPWSPEKDTGSPGPGITHGCELPCSRWEWNTTPVSEQQVLLTTEQSLQSPTLAISSNTVQMALRGWKHSVLLVVLMFLPFLPPQTWIVVVLQL